MRSPAPLTFTWVTALAISAKMWLKFEGTQLSVLTDKKDEHNSLEVPCMRVYLSWQSCSALTTRDVCPEARPSLVVCTCDIMSFPLKTVSWVSYLSLPSMDFPSGLGMVPSQRWAVLKGGQPSAGRQSCVMVPCRELFGSFHPGGGKTWRHGLQSALG